VVEEVGVQGCKCTPKCFDLVKIRAKSVEVCAKFVKTFIKPLKIYANSIKIRAKIWRPTCFALKKWRPKSYEIRIKCGPKFFRAILGKFGQKYFSSPKICLLHHLWVNLPV